MKGLPATGGRAEKALHSAPFIHFLDTGFIQSNDGFSVVFITTLVVISGPVAVK